ncbi:Imm1 family immunity protein [Lentzea californiensis]|uniref:Imm1 family immunity protein n=1 Tax=Lentzea californiensis TaxID=438851 RepID=UPI003557D1AA
MAVPRPTSAPHRRQPRPCGSGRWPGRHQATRVLFYSNQRLPDAYASQGSDTADSAPIYYYMGSDTEFPATAEIPLADVRRAAHEYMSTGGGRPHDITWQVWND